VHLSVHDEVTLNLFAVIFGMSYSATVPPTSALAAVLFGRFSVGVIFGTIFMSHQIGGALGSYVTGLIFDTTGSYHYGLVFGAILCFVAAALSFSIKERPAIGPASAAVR
jgi:MFS family permease